MITTKQLAEVTLRGLVLIFGGFTSLSLAIIVWLGQAQGIFYVHQGIHAEIEIGIFLIISICLIEWGLKLLSVSGSIIRRKKRIESKDR